MALKKDYPMILPNQSRFWTPSPPTTYKTAKAYVSQLPHDPPKQEKAKAAAEIKAAVRSSSSPKPWPPPPPPSGI